MKVADHSGNDSRRITVVVFLALVGAVAWNLGASAALVLIPERGVAIAVMTNLSDAALQNVVNGVRKALIGRS